MTDTELATLSQQGDLEAFNQLARRCSSALYAFARRTLGNDQDAQDACQDALLKAYQNIGRLRDPARFRAWLHHIVLNLCRDRHRARKGRVAQPYEEGLPDEVEILTAQGACTDSDEVAQRVTVGRALNRALGKLPLEQRTAILLREYQGFTSTEIAEITGVPAATVRSRIFHGLRAMRRSLQTASIPEVNLRVEDMKP